MQQSRHHKWNSKNEEIEMNGNKSFFIYVIKWSVDISQWSVIQNRRTWVPIKVSIPWEDTMSICNQCTCTWSTHQSTSCKKWSLVIWEGVLKKGRGLRTWAAPARIPTAHIMEKSVQQPEQLRTDGLSINDWQEQWLRLAIAKPNTDDVCAQYRIISRSMHPIP